MRTPISGLVTVVLVAASQGCSSAPENAEPVTESTQQAYSYLDPYPVLTHQAVEIRIGETPQLNQIHLGFTSGDITNLQDPSYNNFYFLSDQSTTGGLLMYVGQMVAGGARLVGTHRVSGAAVKLALAGTILYALNSYGTLYYASVTPSSDANPSWKLVPGNGVGIHDLAASRDSVFVLGNNAVSGGYGIWRLVDGNWLPFNGPNGGGAAAIAVGGNDNLYTVTDSQGIYFYSESGGWMRFPGLANGITVASDNTPWVLGTGTCSDGSGYMIWRWTNTGWVYMNGCGETLTAGPLGSMYTSNSKGELWHWNN
jgi:hypothetical protein